MEIKFRMTVFGLKTTCYLKDEAIFNAVVKGPEFEESIKTLERIREEVCKEKQLKKEFSSAISSIKESHDAKKVADLFKDHKFERAVGSLEEIYIAIYGREEEYDSEYHHFRNEIKRIADSQIKGGKTGSIRMWTKIIGGASIAALVAATYVKRRNKERKKEGKNPSPG